MKYIIMAMLLVFALGCVVSANPLATATYTQEDEGYRLNFTVDAGLYKIAYFGLYRTDPVDLTAPIGWIGEVSFRETVWYATSVDLYIQPGQSLSGFTCIMPEQPKQIDYFIYQVAPGEIYQSTLIPTAAPVPEPSSILALAGGLAGIGGVALRRRK